MKTKNILNKREVVISSILVIASVYLGNLAFDKIGAILGGAVGGLISYLIVRLLRKRENK